MMGVVATIKYQEPKRPVLDECDACKNRPGSSKFLRWEVIQGIEVRLCIDFITCRERAQAKGIWK